MNIKELQYEIVAAEKIIEKNKMIMQLYLQNEELKKQLADPKEPVKEP